MKNTFGRHAGSYTPLAPRKGTGVARHLKVEAVETFPLFGDDAKVAAREDAFLARKA